LTKNKLASRNKMIDYFHDVSGLSYSKCREILKKNQWDLLTVLDMNTLADVMLSVMEPLREAFRNLAESVNEALNKVDWQQLSEAIKEAQKEDDEDVRDRYSI